MTSALTPEQDTDTRGVLVIGDYPSGIRERLTTLLRPHGVTVSATDTMAALTERIQDLVVMAEGPPPMSLPAPPAWMLDSEPPPNREMRRRAERDRRRRGAR